MKTRSTIRTAVCSLTLLGAACASAPAPAPKPAMAMPLPPNLPPIRIEPKFPTVTYDRVALIWGYSGCPAQPWVVTVVDLGPRTITFRGLASSSELPLYLPPPTGGACYKGPCPTMAVEMAPPPSIAGPSRDSGTGTMTSGGGKGRYSSTSGTCSEPPMIGDADLVDLANRLVAGRNGTTR